MRCYWGCHLGWKLISSGHSFASGDNSWTADRSELLEVGQWSLIQEFGLRYPLNSSDTHQRCFRKCQARHRPERLLPHSQRTGVYQQALSEASSRGIRYAVVEQRSPADGRRRVVNDRQAPSRAQTARAFERCQGSRVRCAIASLRRGVAHRINWPAVDGSHGIEYLLYQACSVTSNGGATMREAP